MQRERIDAYLEVLACPQCKGDLEYKEDRSQGIKGFFCKKCRLLYPIFEDIPVMLPEEAISITNESS
ncbi:hypothetical protein THC_1147 [Caldimicrobium thiodismutans]|jgi:uncharacterized protein YbaR (Trm112 family)|uniref:Trm112 family protein n=1 Tax=Caldimicrobium thiodismutans TaxID=1653476 RepID=A0A0U5B610_9BACT|nr:Trm112 family protein [Caldimicrobium thiodismutans]BAU23520.1 hypothetical protein THC_1147 [Caldimicrobium thiodismutans]